MTNNNPDPWNLLEKLYSGQLSESERDAIETQLAQEPEWREIRLSILLEQIQEEKIPQERWPELLIERSGATPNAVHDFLEMEADLHFVAHHPNLLLAYETAQKATQGLSFAQPPAWGKLIPKNLVIPIASTVIVIVALLIIAFSLKQPAFLFPGENPVAKIAAFPDYHFVFNHYPEAKAAYEKADYEVALKELEVEKTRLLQESPDDILTINSIDFYIATCYFRLNRLDEARLILKRLVDEGSNLSGRPETLFLGAVEFQLHNSQAAQQWMHEAQASEGYLMNGVTISSVARQYLEALGATM